MTRLGNKPACDEKLEPRKHKEKGTTFSRMQVLTFHVKARSIVIARGRDLVHLKVQPCVSIPVKSIRVEVSNERAIVPKKFLVDLNTTGAAALTC